jgi:uncharacterized protein
MDATKSVFLVHGWDGTPDNHWFPWLKEKLEEKGFEVIAPAMPHAGQPKVAEWLDKLSSVVGTPTESDYFVGHSLGCIAIIRYLDSLPEEVKVGGCVFVAGFTHDLGIPEIREFVSLPLDIERAKRRSDRMVTVYSDNDKYIPLSESEDFAKKLGATVVFERGEGHFDSNLKGRGLPVVLESLLSFAKR